MDNDSIDEEKAAPIAELKDFVLNEDPEFPQRVNRSLNRHIFLGDSLEFSLDILQKTMWEYVKSLAEAWPPSKNSKPE